jgi:hypothetical protein
MSTSFARGVLIRFSGHHRMICEGTESEPLEVVKLNINRQDENKLQSWKLEVDLGGFHGLQVPSADCAMHKRRMLT